MGKDSIRSIVIVNGTNPNSSRTILKVSDLDGSGFFEGGCGLSLMTACRRGLSPRKDGFGCLRADEMARRMPLAGRILVFLAAVYPGLNRTAARWNKA